MTLKLYGSGSIENVDSIVTSASATLSATELGNLDGVTGSLLQDPGAWTSWTPTFYNITIGNGSVSAEYSQIGKNVFGRINIAFGSTTSISGTPRFDVPIARKSANSLARMPVGLARYRDEGTADYHGAVYGDANGNVLELLAVRSDGSYTQLWGVSSTVPHSWTTNDDIWATFMYEAA